MRACLRCAFAVILALSFARPPASTAEPAPALTILHFNDDYQLTALDGGKVGGLDRLAALIAQYRRRDRPALLLFAGDLISPSAESSAFKGAQLIDGLNRLAVDAAVLGNHEFDYGPGVLAARVAESHFPWLATNAFVTPGMRPLPGTKQFLIVSAGGVRVGIFGLTTPSTAASSSPGSTAFGDPVAVAKAVLPILRRDGAQVIIALTHLDVSEDELLLREVPQIDLVIGGHDHEPMTRLVDGRLVAKAGSDAKWLGVTRLALDGSHRAMHQLIPVTSQTPSDPAVAALVGRYSDLLGKELEVAIGEAAVPLDAREPLVRAQEAPLGDFIADAIRAAVHADVAITNGGGIRTDAVLPPGPIRRRNVIAWLPFGNVVVKVALRGAAIREALENGVSQWDKLAGRFPQVSGLRFTFNPDRPIGARILDVRVGDTPLDATASYTVATNDFMLRGGDGYAMLSKGQVLVDPAGGPLMATAVAEAIQRIQTVAPMTEGRITIAR
ncbi:MAG TPA: bifunctional UDP-sugar hydrolase/5'-nucleotidase [bacterium]|nr:bifunctional UDP-sugar hydrolase/5'-nucleotidase [bacterium]